MASKDWHLATNLNSTPGAQGTLFSGGSKYASPERYHRGYTPERQAEVHAAVVPSGITSRENPHHIHEVVDTVARSTAPTSHLSGVQWALASPGEHLTSAEARGEGSVAGVYFQGSRQPPSGSISDIKGKPDVVTGTIALKPHATRTGTVLHELGHHVSASQGTEHSQNYDHEHAHGGVEEAFADNYAEAHFRDRRGKQVYRGTYGGGQYAGQIKRGDEFWSGYHSHRDNSMYAADVARQDEDYYHRYPEEKQHPDGSMDVPLINKSYVATTEYPRRKPDLDINWEAQPGY